MKIDLMSDLHLEFFESWGIYPDYEQLFRNQDSDTLIIAGDIMTCLPSLKNDMAEDFFNEATSRYKHTLCVLGNHDYWNRAPWADRKTCNFETMRKECVLRYPAVTFLNPTTPVTLMDTDNRPIRVIGDTLWTNPKEVYRNVVYRRMNDYKEIFKEDGSKITVNDTVKVHLATVKAMGETLERYKDDTFIVVTHHLPYPFCRYPNDPMTSAYATDLSEFILDHPNIRLWCAGHSHDWVDDFVGDCRIVSNPHGYVNVEYTKDWELCHYEV